MWLCVVKSWLVVVLAHCYEYTMILSLCRVALALALVRVQVLVLVSLFSFVLLDMFRLLESAPTRTKLTNANHTDCRHSQTLTAATAAPCGLDTGGGGRGADFRRRGIQHRVSCLLFF